MGRIIGLIGLNYESAPVEVREMMSFSEDQIRQFIKSLKQLEVVSGVVVVSTCNRAEVYFHVKAKTAKQAFSLIYKRLRDYKNLKVSIKKHLYFIDGLEAVKHLFKVAAGLNSMVLGEDQIIGQVKNAFLLSDHEHCAGPVLTRLFNRSFNAGKQVRAETKINEGSASVSTAAVTLAKNQYPDITARSILLIGAGQTGKLSMLSLIDKGCKNLYITNRTYQKAEALEQEFHIKAVPFDRLEEYLVSCDIIMLATGSEKPLIDKKIMDRVMPLRDFRPITILDLSVPRNVTEAVGNIGQVTLFDVDDMETVIKETIEKRRAEIIKAEKIVDDLANDYMEWLASLSLSPTIRQIQENFRKINDIEFKNYLKFKNGDDRQPIKDYGTHISDKFSRLIIKNLKTLTNNGKEVEHLKMLNELFELTIANEK
jgi:glutamyl-tRNA reductase